MPKLNLGCRDDILEGWDNIDLYYSDDRVIFEDVRKLSYGPGTIAEIRAHSILEHLTFEEGETALASWFSILIPGGTISIITPEFDTLFELASRKGVRHIAAPLYGDWKEKGQMHKSCWQKKAIVEVAEEKDLTLIEDKKWLDDMHLVFKKNG